MYKINTNMSATNLTTLYDRLLASSCCPSICLSVYLWQDRIPNTDVLNICGIMGIEAFLLKAQLRWVGHMRMPDSRIPKQVFLGQLALGKRLQCGPVLMYKDALKVNLKQCGIDPSALGDDTQDRSAWRTLCYEAVTQYEDSRVDALEQRAVQKGVQTCSNLSAWPCDSCSRVCSSRLDSTLINKLTDDKRSVDGTVRSILYFRSVLSVRLSVTLCCRMYLIAAICTTKKTRRRNTCAY